MSITELNSLLSQHNINLEQWSHEKGTKTTVELQNEIESGETTLETRLDRLYRVVKLVSVNVQVKLGEQLFTLVEDKQIFFTGAVRKRGLNSLSEKIMAGETPELAVYRCLKEEIGLNNVTKPLINLGFTEEIKSSPSYPTLNSIYQVFNYQVVLDEDDLQFIRFSEYQKNSQKITLFSLELL
ncbi:hypothetical protein ACN4EE_09920 [Geminocystis sp. CENA526]|uniref:hypothetical protein n=1 Tax=Geminocystis sp. CENA526 TaxID=1355871 RepID=UPI003D6EE57E